MPGPYTRHSSSQGARIPSRPVGGKGHYASRSGSSAEDLLSPLGLTRGQEVVQENLMPASPPVGAPRGMPHNKIEENGWRLLWRPIRPVSLRKVLIMFLTFVLVASAWMFSKNSEKPASQEAPILDSYVPPMPHPPAGYTIQANGPNPVEWLRQNTFLDLSEMSLYQLQELTDTRPKAAFISLVRNEELEDMVASIRQVEARFNSRKTHRYDWVFFNNEEFTEEFKTAVSKATSSRCYFERIPEENWSIPPWIDVTRFDVGRQFMGGIGVGKAWLQSYHHMCRWNAGIFALEKRLANYDWFWRVEPAVKFYCDINYDVFRFMRDNNMGYGFNMAILDDARSFPSLWERTKAFIDRNEDLVDEDADFNWLLHTAEDRDETIRPHTGAQVLSDGEYNNCQFYSNFEIGSLNFFRSKEHRTYFDYLDRAGGFYYERFGDAPVHTLSVSMFLPKTRIWYFRDIGYAHGLCEQCPPHEHHLMLDSQMNGPVQRQPVKEQASVTKAGDHDDRMRVAGLLSRHQRWNTMAKDVERQNGIPGLACGCTVSAIDGNNAKLVPFESKQRKPLDPCILLQRTLAAVMVLSTFWMAEMVTPSTRGIFRRAVLYTVIVLGSIWVLIWTVSMLIPSSGIDDIDDTRKSHVGVRLNMEQAEI
ncbi:glycolipid 2-alpha-mannosyltransferase-domain-containing protein [Hypoxylon sp. NC1633]|nr:glycolipid 2-alpha-mannosyltransferase-domain-containing protein [Hypoxylon sp. NC1633]